jgi:hypothetical protein
MRKIPSSNFLKNNKPGGLFTKKDLGSIYKAELEFD